MKSYVCAKSKSGKKWKCTSLGFCGLCKSRSPINQHRFLRLSCNLGCALALLASYRSTSSRVCFMCVPICPALHAFAPSYPLVRAIITFLCQSALFLSLSLMFLSSFSFLSPSFSRGRFNEVGKTGKRRTKIEKWKQHFQALQDLHTSAPLQSQNFSKNRFERSAIFVKIQQTSPNIEKV